MSLQVIKSLNGQAEYVLLPIRAYEALKPQINKILESDGDADEYEAFIPEDFVSNPVALLRIKSCVTQKELAEGLNVSQAYISKLEAQESVSPKALQSVKQALLVLQEKNKSNR